jgi:hypothetical protein
MKTFGPLFAGRIHVKDAPFIHVAPTAEVEYPYRSTNHSVILRNGIVFGVWRKKKRTFEEHFLTALGGRNLEDTHRQAAFEAANKNASASGEDLE